MVTDSAAVVMFAIRSGIKFSNQMRKAYIDNIKRRELMLPLPEFFSSPDIVSAINYFNDEGKHHIKKSNRLDKLIKKHNSTGLEEKEEAELNTLYTEFFNLDLAEKGRLGISTDGTVIDADDLNALLTIRQWRRDTDPNPPVLQRVAGTFIEIGIDYFVNVPGALNEESKYGKAIGSFLDALNGIRFSEEQLSDLPTRLFIATIETISENSDLLSGDDKVQELIKVTAITLSKDVASRIDQIGGQNLEEQERVTKWAELVFRSVLSSAGKMVAEDPKGFLGIKDGGEEALIKHVGGAALSLVLDQPDRSLDRVFSREGLETMIKAALAAVGEHPQILLNTKNNEGLQKILSEVASTLSKYDTIMTPNMLPELIRLILDKTGENIELLWPDLTNKPENNLILVAASTTLDILTKKPKPEEKWKPQFSREDLMKVTEIVLDELVENPGWLIDSAGALNNNLKLALEAALEVIRKRADKRLGTETIIEVLQASLKAVALRKEFLDKMPQDVAMAGKPIFAAALDAIIGTIFKPGLEEEATWQLLSSKTIVGIVKIGLISLSKVKLEPQKVKLLEDFMRKQVELMLNGEPWDLETFEAGLTEAFA